MAARPDTADDTSSFQAMHCVRGHTEPTQRMFDNNKSFMQISRNSDYFVVFKNPRDASEIGRLAQQLTPGKRSLLGIYEEATGDPFSYLFIDLTQECSPAVKYTSHLFNENGVIRVYQESG